LTRACFSPDGHRILTTGADGSARVWDLAGNAGTPAATPRSFSADATRYLTVATHSVQVWDAASGQAIGPALIPKPGMQTAALVPDGRFLLTCSTLPSEGTNHVIQVWEVAAGQPLGPGLAFSNAPGGVSLAEQGKRLVVFDGNQVQTWNALTGSPLSPPVSLKGPVSQSFFSHDGNRVATISGREVRVWDARTGRALFAPLINSQPIQTGAFSPNDRYLVIGGSDNLLTACYAQVYDAANGQPASPRLNHGAGVLRVAFSPDSRRVVTASADFTAVVWDYATGRQVAPPLKHDNQVRSATFSPDGRWIVTASADKTARVWEARSGEPLTPSLRSVTPLAQAGFLADQRGVVTVDDQGSARVWKLTVELRPLPMLLSLVCLLSGDTTSRAAQQPGSPSMEALWQQFRNQYPAEFAVSPEEIAAWHELQAQDSELQARWFAAAFHLEHLLPLRAGDPSVSQRLARAKKQLQNSN
jgi:WD40 repeat protein